jgi:carbamoyl-phosphate synthase large subunit
MANPHRKLNHIAVKEAVFPFARFPGVDTLLGPEMRSTGEVMGLDRDFAMAFAKAQLGAAPSCRKRAPCSSRCATRTRNARRRGGPQFGPRLQAHRHRRHPALISADKGVAVERVNKVLEGRPHIVDAIRNGEVQLVFNTTEGAQGDADSKPLRRAALMQQGALFHHHGEAIGEGSQGQKLSR